MSAAAVQLIVNPSDGTSPIARIAPIETEIDRLQRELAAVTSELDALRKRDETLKFHMHRLDEELRLAARVQQDFLPKSLPQVGEVRFSTVYRPAGFVSGDLYDVMRLDESHVGFYMADAVGHGMPAALLTMFLKNALVTKEIFPGGYRLLPPSQTLERLNESLVSQNLSQATFATAVYGVIDCRSRMLTLARGGHPSPLRLSPGGDIQPLTPEGSLLGIFPGEKFEEVSIQLDPGDRIFLYTDGIELAFSGEHAMDTQLWQEAIHNRRRLPTSEMVVEFVATIDREGATPLKDDLTLIVIDVG